MNEKIIKEINALMNQMKAKDKMSHYSEKDNHTVMTEFTRADWLDQLPCLQSSLSYNSNGLHHHHHLCHCCHHLVVLVIKFRHL